jgi:hypothetical protein
MRKSIHLFALASLLAASLAGAQTSISRKPGETQRAPPPSAEEQVASLDTAGRARLLLEADRDMREAFADYQQALAKAREKGKVAGAEAVLSIDPMRAPRDALRAVGDDMSNEALALQDASRATRSAFAKFTRALDREEQLIGAAGETAVATAFGPPPAPVQ